MYVGTYDPWWCAWLQIRYDDVIMGTIAPQITSLTIVYSTVYSDADQRKHQSSASLAFVWGIHRGPVNSPHKWPVTRKMFPFDDVIMPTISELIIYILQLWHTVLIYSFRNMLTSHCILHYNDVIMNTMVSQITGVWIIYSTFCSCPDQRKHHSSA